MVGELKVKCCYCNEERENAVDIYKYADTINKHLPVTVHKKEGPSPKCCHKCLFQMTLTVKVVKKYTDMRELLVAGDNCYLCFKENINYTICGELFLVVRKIELSLTLKDMIFKSGTFSHDDWEKLRRKLKNRKICSDCYFLVDSMDNFYEKFRLYDDDLKKVLEKAEHEYEVEDESDDENNAASEDEGIEDDEELEEELEDEEEVEGEEMEEEDEEEGEDEEELEEEEIPEE